MPMFGDWLPYAIDIARKAVSIRIVSWESRGKKSVQFLMHVFDRIVEGLGMRYKKCWTYHDCNTGCPYTMCFDNCDSPALWVMIKHYKLHSVAMYCTLENHPLLRSLSWIIYCFIYNYIHCFPAVLCFYSFYTHVINDLINRKYVTYERLKA